MQNILEFNDYVVEKYGHFAQVEIHIVIPDKGIDKKVPVSFLSDYSGMSLSVSWLMAGVSNYQELGLLDLYFTTWDNMTYNEADKSLAIIDPNGVLVMMYA
ncbi:MULTISPECIES: hypothetical protein [Vagococcus]|uniref:hypothetical protein n=1 Tax=Vagococcus TaxID=2737 RepID=UPI002FCC75EE